MINRVYYDSGDCLKLYVLSLYYMYSTFLYILPSHMARI